ncbi:M28 family metallopeptidase [Plantactinospora soyae]|uniref:Zn-dependent M28 family amino/carboxypeptidase n=1 Tax=Plantactinospora soyae TaxID=1544732 RepID=A0A927M0V2_9ACTN|nr:M28 family metallopeptidase [Plantactinospora soyae]MBE1485964.1 Zn-dependent M28 family amino/carboxypeptidase [Plantactinospora soyae]
MGRTSSRWSRGLLATTLVTALAVVAAPAPAQADLGSLGSWALRKAVTAKGVQKHLKELQKIADRNGGNRASGASGYDRSVDYAEKVLRRAGYRVTRQQFDFQTFLINTPSELQRTSAPAGDLPHRIMSYSGSADVTAPASVPTGDSQGCAASDFGPANVGTIVLISRGTCPFGQKASNAAAAGAAATVIYNNISGDLSGTLGNTYTLDFAALGVSQALGQELVGQVAGGLTLRVFTDTFRGMASTENLLAESRWGNPGNVVMAGAHLDSVPEGPGINDNGSGSAALLEIAEKMSIFPTRNKVRFALWGAEEANLVGSTHYVANLPAAERDRIALYLNFDMVGSPNYVRFVYDGDNSAFPPGTGSAVGPPGSGAIEKLFHDYFRSQRLASAETPFSGRSDYGPFIAAGVDIPSGGLFTGAELVKTAEEARVYGGTAGVAYDPCYHQACDDIDNISLKAIDEMSDAVAHAVITYAYDTRSLTAPTSGPASGTTAPAGGGGGLHDDHEVAI